MSPGKLILKTGKQFIWKVCAQSSLGWIFEVMHELVIQPTGPGWRGLSTSASQPTRPGRSWEQGEGRVRGGGGQVPQVAGGQQQNLLHNCCWKLLTAQARPVESSEAYHSKLSCYIDGQRWWFWGEVHSGRWVKTTFITDVFQGQADSSEISQSPFAVMFVLDLIYFDNRTNFPHWWMEIMVMFFFSFSPVMPARLEQMID